ncbi:MAG: methyltransferase domain-containing protein [Chloroflexota bacterium]|nr:methyltransferase domain-containing protein [Chloroflexota bacterium]
MRWRERELLHRFYPPDPDPVGELERRFLDAIERLVRPGDRVLDAGCGSGRLFTYELRGRASLIVGLDIGPDVAQNPNIEAPVLGDLAALPFVGEAFDLIICKHVLEHLEEPQGAFSELSRVLRAQGRLLILTPNRFHYVPLLASLLPHPFQRIVARGRGLRLREVHRTLYRANTAARLRRLARTAGLRVAELHLFETAPVYLAFNPLAFALGVAYEKVVNRFPALAPLRVNLLAVLRKR